MVLAYVFEKLLLGDRFILYLAVYNILLLAFLLDLIPGNFCEYIALAAFPFYLEF